MYQLRYFIFILSCALLFGTLTGCMDQTAQNPSDQTVENGENLQRDPTNPTGDLPYAPPSGTTELPQPGNSGASETMPIIPENGSNDPDIPSTTLPDENGNVEKEPDNGNAGGQSQAQKQS